MTTTALGVCLLVCLLQITYGAVTTTKHPTHHHNNNRDGIAFFFDDSSDNLIMKKGTYCYFLKLNDAEQQDVHNPDGLRALEVNLMTLYTTAAHLGLTGSDHGHISRYVYTHFCVHEHLIKLVE